MQEFVGTKAHIEHKAAKFTKTIVPEFSKNEAFVLSSVTTRDKYAREY